MSESRFYPASAHRMGELAEHLREKYALAGYEVQVLHVTERDRGLIFQMRQKYNADWKKAASQLTGLDTAATVTIRSDGEGLSVEVGGGKWLDKAAVAGFATFVTLGVLIIPAGIGAWKQRRLLSDLVVEIDNFIKRKTQTEG
ncbi:MAG: hypothetical protein ACE5IQ_00260 [Candidatus Methylomirabilales bacterium]